MKFQSKMSAKFRYPGFHLVYLPFAEDKRDLSEYLCHPYGEWPKGSFHKAKSDAYIKL